MLIAMRKHTKVIFWIIIILIVPAFAVFWVPRLRSSGGQPKYGRMFGRTVTAEEFFGAQDAELHAMRNLGFALTTMAYRKPAYDFLRVQRELLLARLAQMEMVQGERFSLKEAGEILKQQFADPKTGEYDAEAYRKRLRELGMTDDEYLGEFHENIKVQRELILPMLYAEGEEWYQHRRHATWYRLVLAHEAEALGIRASDEEVLSYLYLLFPGEDGVIDEELYGQHLRQRGTHRSEFEDEVRTTIRIAKLQGMILDSVKVPPQIVATDFDERYKTMRIAYHLEPYEPLVEPRALREDEVLAFYVKNRRMEVFRIDPQVAVMYVLVEAKDFYSKVEVSDDELRAYYEAHPDAFTAEDGTARPYEACAEEVRAAVVEADHVGEAEKLAQTHASRLFSLSSPVRFLQEAAKRGYEVHETPLFGKEGKIDDIVGEDEKDFRDAAFGLDVGKVSSLVKVKQGWCVLSPTYRVPDPKGTKHRLFDEVADVARTEAARARARELVHELSAGFFERAEAVMEEESVGFVQACSGLGLDVTETAFLSKDDEEVAGLEDGRHLIYRAFVAGRLLEGEIYEPKDVYVVDVDAGTVFFNVLETRLPDEATWAKKGAQFRQIALRPLRNNAYGEWFQQVFSESAVDDQYEIRRQEALQADKARAEGLGQP